MTTRRSFLRSLTTTAAGLLVAEDALALLVEPRRKLWAGHTFGPVLARPVLVQHGRTMFVNGFVPEPPAALRFIEQRSYDAGKTWWPQMPFDRPPRFDINDPSTYAVVGQ